MSTRTQLTMPARQTEPGGGQGLVAKDVEAVEAVGACEAIEAMVIIKTVGRTTRAGHARMDKSDAIDQKRSRRVCHRGERYHRHRSGKRDGRGDR